VKGRAKLVAALIAVTPVGASAAAPANEAELGQAVYSNCAACHGDKGQGGFAPPFAGNPDLRDGPAMIAHVVAGSVNMPPFGDQLSPDQIAAVLNHVRNSWGNRAATVNAADVAAVERQVAPKRK
jgi:mono/diheme cytochrome c family protein